MVGPDGRPNEVARFLSAEWFDELEAAGVHDGAGAPRPEPGQPPAAPLVIEISVTGAPQGEVRYQVVVEGAQARVLPPGTTFRSAQVALSSDYATMAGIASGELSAIDALSYGRARVSGDTTALSAQPFVAGLDLMPVVVRARTTY